jgi:hypothetical protein
VVPLGKRYLRRFKSKRAHDALNISSFPHPALSHHEGKRFVIGTVVK